MCKFIALAFQPVIFSVSFIAVAEQSRVLYFSVLKTYLSSSSHTCHIDVPRCGTPPGDPATVPQLPHPVFTMSRAASTLTNPPPDV